MHYHRLKQEIRNTKGTLVNILDMRRDHPSYGYTKTEANMYFYILRGMVEAYCYATGFWDNAGVVVWTPGFNARVMAELNVNIHELGNKVRES